MARLKKTNSNSWLMPSFEAPLIDSEPPKPKRRRPNNYDETLSNDLSAIDIVPVKRNISNLSKLLAICEPKKSSELAISRQKQKEIANWLEFRVKKGRPAALVLSGPSGCGKTMALRVLAKEYQFDVTEWITPIDQLMDENNRIQRQGDKFEDYVIRATRYSSLLSEYSSRLLLVKEFPHVYMDDKEGFCSLLEKYFEMGKEPIVFVCTDSGNSIIMRNLFAAKIREKYGIDSITINAVTPAATKTALKRVTEILNANASHILHVTQDKIDEILSNNVGDIRSAILNLIFMSLKVPETIQKSGNTLRQESLGLLHGVGRVINPKRVQTGSSWKFVHDPDDIAAYFESQASIFLNFVQENYTNTMSTLDDVEAAATLLSDAQILNSEWRDRSLTKLALSLCVRGVMVYNEHPVSGWNPVRKAPSDLIEVKRCLVAAEDRFYESVIKPSAKKEQLDCGVEGIVE